MSKTLINVVLDLETLGTYEDAAIIQIGMCVPEFDRKYIPPGMSYECEETIAYEECLTFIAAKTFTQSNDTMMWWQNQNPETRKIVFSGQSTYTDAFECITFFLHNITSQGAAVAIWGNGSDFDNRLLSYSMSALGYAPPWNFRANRDLRTLKALFPANIEIDPTEIKHTALGDARYEARLLHHTKTAYAELYNL